MKRILVPTDFSEKAEYALKVAAQLARSNDGEIIILHMLELPHQGSDAVGNGSTIPEIMFFKNKALEKLDNLMESDYLQGLNVSRSIQFEKAFEGILGVSKTNHVDFIVMGSNGSSGLREMFIGSNTEKVVRSSDVPVLVIKNEILNFNAGNFVFASDFSPKIKKPFLKIKKFADFFNAHIHFVTINTVNSFNPTHVIEKIFNEFIAEFDIKNYSTHIYNDSNIERGILNFAASVNADVIGMCTHGRTGLSHLFNGSISEDLVNHTYKPVLTLKI